MRLVIICLIIIGLELSYSLVGWKCNFSFWLVVVCWKEFLRCLNIGLRVKGWILGLMLVILRWEMLSSELSSLLRMLVDVEICLVRCGRF